jgi:hypothetical protein
MCDNSNCDCINSNTGEECFCDPCTCTEEKFCDCNYGEQKNLTEEE